MNPSASSCWNLLAALATTAAFGQTATPSGPAAGDLARYDRNRNGQLEADELAARDADLARARGAVATMPAPAADEQVVELSPFEVTADTNGYYAASTMSGTRLNTRIEDLASSISVVTKQQMADFAILDINDIFNYESNTEGVGNYTAFEVDRNGMVTDRIQDNPQGANRMRGIGPANIAVDNFATSGRVPIDPIDIDAVEISRGPNSSIFGLGEGSGTVNLVSASASLDRATSATSFRIDDLGGWRTSLDVNRPLMRGKVGLRVSGVYQHDDFPQQPAGFDTRRFNVMLRARPFRNTTLRASFQSYHGVGTRATSVTPRDAVSYWQSVGRPAWDPVTSTMTTGAVSTPFGTATPAVLGLGTFGARPALFVDERGVSFWSVQRTPAANATNGPNNTGGAIRFMESIPEPIRTGHPLFSTVPGISDFSLYNWEEINLAAPNTIKDQVETSTVSFEQIVLDAERHKLAFQVAWQREDADRINRNVIGQASATGSSYYLHVDVNSRLLDGRPNPYFLRPYVGVGEPVTEERPYVRDSYRGQGAYVLDLRNNRGWTRWLGRHQLLGYYEERKSKTYRYRFRDVMVSDHPLYAPAGQPKGNQSGVAAPAATRGYYRFYVGDNAGQNIDYAPTAYSPGSYTFNWFDNLAGRWVADPATLGRAGINEGTAGNFAVLNLIKTRGAVLQSSLLQDRVVLTLGLREDENRNKGQRPSVLKPNGWEFDYAAMDGWVGDWALRSGETKTTGVVLRPFRSWRRVDDARRTGGIRGLAAEALHGLQFHYNKSDSFRPEPPAISITLRELPNPTSLQEEYGFSLNLFSGKFVFRANHYENNQVNTRAGQSAIFATRTLRVDFQNFAGNNDQVSLQRQARLWVAEASPALTATQVDARVAEIMGLTPQQLAQFNENVISETSDALAKGDEFELNVNPNRHWTLRFNATRQEAVDANLSPNIPAWIASRLPLWQRIVDPRVNNGPGQPRGAPWFTTRYPLAADGTPPATGNNMPQIFLQNNVVSPLSLVQATEGKARPQTREWRFNLLTSYRLAGVTEQKHLARVTVGGALRWEGEGAIGYFGIPVNGDLQAATQFDPNRPIYDKAHTYVDVFAGYTTRLFRDKVRARLQLNVRNLQESGRLQVVGAYPDGRGHTFRIINPRLFIFTASFDL